VARFAFLTGWRRGEILSLTWADVDRDGGVVRLRPEHSKNRQGRTLAIEATSSRSSTGVGRRGW